MSEKIIKGYEFFYSNEFYKTLIEVHTDENFNRSHTISVPFTRGIADQMKRGTYRYLLERVEGK